MENSKLIHEFTDGTLEPAQEPVLFSQLANDEELRQEFKQELAIKSAIRSDKKAYTPAAASTLGIFSSLGFAPPAAAVGTAIAGGVATGAAKSMGILSKLSASMITGVVATVATAVISYFVFQPQIENLMTSNKKLSSEITNLKNKPEIPHIQSQEKSVESANANVKAEKPLVKYIYITKEVPVKEVIAVRTEDVIIQDETPIEENLESANLFTLNNSNVINSYNHQGFDINSPLFGAVQPFAVDISEWVKISTDLGITLELNKMENWFEFAPTINPKQFSKFNNSSATLLYEAINGLHVGAELRQETFFQNFTGTDKEGVKFRYQQQPNFTSLGFVLRYANKDINIFGIYPYLQAYAGGTNVGPIARMLSGLRYSPYNGIIFHIAAEYSRLYYKHQTKDFQSGKYDLNYGISFEF